MTGPCDTDFIAAGRNPPAFFGMVNPPVCRASTILYPHLAAFEAGKTHAPGQLTYGRYGTPTTLALEEAMTGLARGHGSLLYPSGLAAISGTLSALLAPGDHLAMIDTAYAPARRFAATHLGRIGVRCDFFAATPAGLRGCLRGDTRVVYLEAPGSLTFEVPDMRALVSAVREQSPGAVIVFDNTWSTPMLFRPLEHGADVVVEAATKYLCGHSDVMMGIATASAAAHARLEPVYRQFGWCVGADDAYAVLRGLRTLGPRLRQHGQTGLELARWLALRPQVERVLHPGLPDHPDHAVWLRDWSGASGLFGIVLRPVAQRAWEAFFDGLAHFGLGGSWGGYESLLFPDDPSRHRSAGAWRTGGRYLRVHAGLEDPRDLIEDLAKAFARMQAAAALD